MGGCVRVEEVGKGENALIMRKNKRRGCGGSSNIKELNGRWHEGRRRWQLA